MNGHIVSDLISTAAPGRWSKFSVFKIFEWHLQIRSYAAGINLRNIGSTRALNLVNDRHENSPIKSYGSTLFVPPSVPLLYILEDIGDRNTMSIEKHRLLLIDSYDSFTHK